MSSIVRELSSESHDMTLSEGLARAVRFTQATEPPMAEAPETSEELLKRTLSTKSVVSTLSSFAERMQRAATRSGADKEPYRIIGLGSCGSVFEIPGTELAFKKGSSDANLWQDFTLTNQVHNAILLVQQMLQKAFPEFTLPKTPLCTEYHPTYDKDFWTTHLHRFPAGHQTIQPLFLVDRILPLPQVTREALIIQFFDEDSEVQDEARDDQGNKDCLVRIYLGERETVHQQNGIYDSLRNFPLRLNMMEELDLDVEAFAHEMALGLATLHWQAQVDGMDTEYVLGSSTTLDNNPRIGYVNKSGKSHIVTGINFKRRSTHLWMLDFDKASDISLTIQDVDSKLVPAFLGNDPYYPRPQVDEELWGRFCEVYLKASEVILRNKGVNEQTRGLPRQFLDKVIRVSKDHEDWNENDNIAFAD